MPVIAGIPSFIGLAAPGLEASEEVAVLVSTLKSWRWLDGASISSSGITWP